MGEMYASRLLRNNAMYNNKEFPTAIGGGTIFKVGGGGRFLEVKNGASAPAVALARRRGCLRGDVPPSEVGAFLKM